MNSQEFYDVCRSKAHNSGAHAIAASILELAESTRACAGSLLDIARGGVEGPAGLEYIGIQFERLACAVEAIAASEVLQPSD